MSNISFNRGLFCAALLAMSLVSCVSSAVQDSPGPLAAGCETDKTPMMASQSDGGAWRRSDVVINQSTPDDLIERLGNPGTIVPLHDKQGAVVICIYNYGSLDYYPGFWVINDKVAGIHLTGAFDDDSGIPADLDMAQREYGKWDMVGWSTLGSGYRSIVWFDEGVQADIFVATRRVSQIMLFAGMSEEEFRASPVSRLYLDDPGQSKSDDIDPSPKNPFDH